MTLLKIRNMNISAIQAVILPLVAWGTLLLVPLVQSQDALPELSILPEIAESEGEILLRGPVHEAFASPIAYDPTLGPIISVEPPEPIDELPPEFMPEGENVIWIPGYWAWDEERSDFIWISGLWRSAPPDHEWAPGYWYTVEGGYQWIPGGWLPIASEELVYYPEPPSSLEQGPNTPAPSVDYFWSPGVWVYIERSYRWRPGVWMLGRPNWVWTPSCYRRAARGYLYIDGYWDYDYVSRGRLFAPVYFQTPHQIHNHYHYSPRIVVHVDQRFMTQLFVNMSCQRYHFGDYHSARVTTYRPCYDYHAHARGYSPYFSYNDWRYRQQGIDYSRHLESWGRHYQSHPEYRPPRTWNDQASYLDRHHDYAHASHATLGTQIGRNMDQGRSTYDRMEHLSQSQRNDFSRSAREFQNMAVERHRIESAHSQGRGPDLHQEFRLPNPASHGPSHGGLPQNGPSGAGLSNIGRLINGASDNNDRNNGPHNNRAIDNLPTRPGLAQNGLDGHGAERNGPDFNRPGQNGPGTNAPGGNGPNQMEPGLNGLSHNGADREQLPQGATLRERLDSFREAQAAAGAATPRTPDLGLQGNQRPPISHGPDLGGLTSRPDRPNNHPNENDRVVPSLPDNLRPDPRHSTPGRGNLSGSATIPPSRTVSPHVPERTTTGSTLLDRLRERSEQSGSSSLTPPVTRTPASQSRTERTTPDLSSRTRQETPSFQRSTPLFQSHNSGPQPRTERTTPDLSSRTRPETPSLQRSTPLFQNNNSGPQPRAERSVPDLSSRTRPTTPSPLGQRSSTPSSGRSSSGGGLDMGGFSGGNNGPPSNRGGGGSPSGPGRNGRGRQ
jgi:hypothetical protein